MWVAWRRLDLEAERACDDAVVRLGDATVYADQLVTLASRMASTTRHPLLAMANRNDLARRVAAVLQSGRTRGRVGRLSAAAVLVCASTVVMAIAPLQAVRGHQARSIFTAAQEQLGLRLEDRRREIPTPVIDSVERPSPN